MLLCPHSEYSSVTGEVLGKAVGSAVVGNALGDGEGSAVGWKVGGEGEVLGDAVHNMHFRYRVDQAHCPFVVSAH